MKALLFILVCNVYPLLKGQPAPVNVVAFDTIAAQRLLIKLDSLEYVKGQLKLYIKRSEVADSLIKAYERNIMLKDSLLVSINDKNKLYEDEIKRLKRNRWFERIGYVLLLGIVIYLSK